MDSVQSSKVKAVKRLCICVDEISTSCWVIKCKIFLYNRRKTKLKTFIQTVSPNGTCEVKGRPFHLWEEFLRFNMETAQKSPGVSRKSRTDDFLSGGQTVWTNETLQERQCSFTIGGSLKRVIARSAPTLELAVFPSPPQNRTHPQSTHFLLLLFLGGMKMEHGTVSADGQGALRP